MKKKVLDILKIKQQPHYCGIACLSMVANYFGYNLTQDDIAEKFFDPGDISEEGVWASDITKVARKIGFKASTKLRFTLDDIIKSIDKNNPVIALSKWHRDTSINHYYLIKGYDEGGSIFVNDPMDLRKNQFFYDEFRKLWCIKNETKGDSYSRNSFYEYLGIRIGP